MAGINILLVEGKDDEHVLKHLSTAHGGPRFDEVHSHNGGVSTLLSAIPVRLKAAGDAAAAGIVLDADTDCSGRWDALRRSLMSVGYFDVPAEAVVDGTIVNPPSGAFLPRVGIWIMPDNKTAGILEDFVRFLIPEDSPLFDHVTESVKNIPPAERRFSELATPKALIHTWLAWQEQPGRPLGLAITAKYLEADVPQARKLVAWLKRLFD